MTLRLGVVALWKALPKQLARCRVAYQGLTSAPSVGSEESKPSHQKHRWWDYCDCNPCDLIPYDGGCDGPIDFDLPCDCSP